MPQKFPKYLPSPDDELLKRLGRRLHEIRLKARPAQISKDEQVLISDFEKGNFRVSLGYLREVIRRVYGLNLEDLLRDVYGSESDRHFDRDQVYSMRWKQCGDKDTDTPFLVGGSPGQFLWAVPMRFLKGQKVSVEYLELAPRRERNRSGRTTGLPHEGVEVISVIFGKVVVHITGEGRTDAKELTEGQAVHLHSKYRHSVSNLGTGTPALLIIIRTF